MPLKQHTIKHLTNADVDVLIEALKALHAASTDEAKRAAIKRVAFEVFWHTGRE